MRSDQIVAALRDVVFDDDVADVLADAIKANNPVDVGVALTNAVRTSVFNSLKENES